MMIGWMHKKREATVILLQFVAVCSLLSMVCATTPELPAGETIGQWVWFGKAVLVSTRLYHCFLFATTSRKSFLDRYFVFPEFLCSCGLEPSIVRGN